MKCPYCGSIHVNKNGRKYNKQRYICRDCKKTISEGSDDRIKRDIKQRELCLLLYTHNMSMRSIQSTINKFYNTNIAIRLIEKWIKSFVKLLKMDIDNNNNNTNIKIKEDKPKKIEILEMDELYSKYYDSKKNEQKELKYGLLLIDNQIKLLVLR